MTKQGEIFFFVLGNVPPSQQNRCAFTFAALWWWLTDFMPDIQKRLFLKALHGWPASSSGLLLPAKWGWFMATSYCSSFFFMLRKGARGKNVLFSECERKKKKNVHYFAAFLPLQHLIYSVVRSSSRNHLDKRCVEIPKANIHHTWTGTVIDFSSLNKVNQDTLEQLQHPIQVSTAGIWKPKERMDSKTIAEALSKTSILHEWL